MLYFVHQSDDTSIHRRSLQPILSIYSLHYFYALKVLRKDVSQLHEVLFLLSVDAGHDRKLH